MLEKFWEEDGYRMEIVFTDMGHRCGYIHLPEGHVFEGVEFNKLDCGVHGGLTYSRRIGGRWVLGFDCAHCWDAPDLEAMRGYRIPEELIAVRRESLAMDGIIRTKEYVERELLGLLEQLKGADR